MAARSGCMKKIPPKSHPALQGNGCGEGAASKRCVREELSWLRASRGFPLASILLCPPEHLDGVFALSKPVTWKYSISNALRACFLASRAYSSHIIRT
jgi:hypothetical protein